MDLFHCIICLLPYIAKDLLLLIGFSNSWSNTHMLNLQYLWNLCTNCSGDFVWVWSFWQFNPITRASGPSPWNLTSFSCNFDTLNHVIAVVCYFRLVRHQILCSHILIFFLVAMKREVTSLLVYVKDFQSIYYLEVMGATWLLSHFIMTTSSPVSRVRFVVLNQDPLVWIKRSLKKAFNL